MHSSFLIQVALICLLGAMSPGPSLAVVLRRSFIHGRKTGIIISLSHGIGVGVVALIASSTLGLFIMKSPSSANIITIIGGLIIFFIGIFTIIVLPQKETIQFTTHFNNESQHPSNLLGAIIEGFLVACLNPKILIFFTALFAPLVATGIQGYIDIFFLAIMAFIIDALWYVFVVITSTHFISKFKNEFVQRIIQYFTGIMLLIYGSIAIFSVI